MAKKKKNKKKPSTRWKLYKVSGGKLESSNKSCPKCGSGVFMAKHSNRETCGTCHYTIFESRSI